MRGGLNSARYSPTDLFEQLDRVPFQELDANRILEIAISDKLTFNEASYLVAAELKRMTLVTDDAELCKSLGSMFPFSGQLKSRTNS